MRHFSFRSVGKIRRVTKPGKEQALLDLRERRLIRSNIGFNECTRPWRPDIRAGEDSEFRDLVGTSVRESANKSESLGQNKCPVCYVGHRAAPSVQSCARDGQPSRPNSSKLSG